MSLNDLAVHIRGDSCLAFIIEPLKLSQEKVYQTISGVDEGLSLLSKDIIIEDLEWTNKKNYLMRPAFISMLYPEILKLHFEAITSGISIILDFDKISSLEDMSKYMMCVECLYNHEEYPSDLNIDYKSREEALQAYTESLIELCIQCYPDAKAVLQYLILTILVSTSCGDITEEDTPELFTLVKDLARPLKISEAELKTFIDQGVKHVKKTMIPNAYEQYEI